MNFLFVHQNFPGQYVHVARYLANAGHRVVFITQQRGAEIDRVRKIEYTPPKPAARPHLYVRDLEAGVINGQAVAGICDTLKRDGFVPDLMVGHNGWGEILYLKEIWPQAPLLGYFEFYYRATGADVGFDPEFPGAPDDAMRLRTRNVVNLLGLEAADCGQAPTEWQRSGYPRRYWDQIKVIHEGIDTDVVRPDATARLWLRGGVSLSREDEIITYCGRNLEPYRGFHIFMRALPEVLRRHPKAKVVIIGADGVSYGKRSAKAATYREQMLDELRDQLDLERVHFVGQVPYRQYLAILQLSSVHAYLSYPFVLSWSCLEAMAAGCAVIGSRTAPVEEVVRDGENGYLVDFFDIQGWSDRISAVLCERDRQDDIRAAARKTVVDTYDLRRVCLPAHLRLMRQLTNSPPL